ncbi:uncharacterized protein LOC143556862 [Bidens hawaiensis]|uniref:uncharacterized protein LOC143556862 n=1 Tax=Bidens hawaiensis TaxID=980011 RepID=UPI00404A89D2
MYRQCFNLLEEKDRRHLVSVNSPIMGFDQSIEYPLGQLTFPVTLSDGTHSRTEDVDFLVMESPRPSYDVILGREAIGDFNANPYTTHEILEVPTPTWVTMIYANHECHVADIKTPPNKVLKVMTQAEPEKWVLNGKFPKHTITIGPTLYNTTLLALKRLLINSIDVFAWTLADLTGVPRFKAGYHLKVKPTFVPVVQKRRKMGPDQAKACKKQVQQLLDAGIICTIHHQTWVANPFMVPRQMGNGGCV